MMGLLTDVLRWTFGGALALLGFLWAWLRLSSGRGGAKHVVVAVMGDIGRSPRMQRHAISALRNLPQNYHIDVVGFKGSSLMRQLRDELAKEKSRLTVKHISSLRLLQLPFVFYALLKVASETLSLLGAFVSIAIGSGNIDCVVIQNPPFIPLAQVCKFVSVLSGAKLVIDWHNFGFSILALKRSGKAVAFYKYLERTFGRLGDSHICVSETMRQFLIREWQFSAGSVVTVCDRPTSLFTETLGANAQKEMDAKLRVILNGSLEGAQNAESVSEAKGEDFWVVTSTSFTKDEDIGAALIGDSVLSKVDSAQLSAASGRLVLFVTGKDDGSGAKQQFMRALAGVRLSAKTVVCPIWIECYEAYVQLLRRCDAGLCFHSSSSGVDLPMKVVDFFGAGLPVIAKAFHRRMGDALPELLEHNQRGLVFQSSQQLVDHITAVYNDRTLLTRFRRNIKQFTSVLWDDEWRRLVKPLIIPSSN